MKHSPSTDQDAALTSLAEQLRAIDATIAAVATALTADGSRSADVAKTLREFVSPQLRAQVNTVTGLIALRQRSAFN